MRTPRGWRRLLSARFLLVPALCIGLVALIWGVLAYQTAYERQAAIERRQQEQDNLVRLFEEQVLAVLASASVTLRNVESEYRRHGARLDLAQYLRERPELRSYHVIAVIDGDGSIVLSSAPFTRPLSVRETESFQYHLNNTSLDLFVPKPRFGIATGKWTLYLTRRMNRPDGGFGGNTTIGIDPAYFSGFYDLISLGPDSMAMLAGRDGVVRARRSNETADGGQDLRQSPLFTTHLPAREAGHGIWKGAVDGVTRLLSYRSVKGFPLVVVVGSSRDVTLAPVEQRTRAYRWWAGGISVVILGFAVLVTLQGIRRQRYEQALRESDARFRSLTAMSSDFYWESDVEHRLMARGPDSKVPKVSAFDNDAQVGLRRWEIPHLSPNEVGWRAHRAVLDAHRPFRGFELSRLGTDGTLRHILISGEPVFDASGVFKGYRGVGSDISARKRAEAAHVGLEAQLRESQKMEAIGTLAGGIAHDFNNILATILGNAELARQDVSANPLALQSLEEIRKAGSRARALVQQILSFSRRQPAEHKPTALAPIVEDSVRLLRATLPARVVLNVRCDADVPSVLADATQIEQVLINLATNAMQAMQGAPGRIDIRLDAVMLDAALAEAHPALGAMHARRPGRTPRLALSDDGPGMDAATLERIFEPFFTTKQVDEGTGLGLAVVYGIVQGHEGAIVVDSQPGKGATFTLYLPAAESRAGAPAPGPRESAAAAGPATAPSLRLDGGPHILYLDDDESLVFLVQRLLERRGYRVSGYTDQREALAALRADPHRFDLVVSDYNMPGMSGLDVARAVRALRADLPVAVASGFIDEALRAQAGGAGVRELIFKADAAEDLCEAFARLARTVWEKAS